MFALIDPSTRKLLCEAVSSVVLQMLSNSAVHFCEKCFVRRNLMQEWMKEYFCVCALQIPPFQNCTLKPFLKPKLAGRCNILKEGRRYVTDPLQLLKKFSDFFPNTSHLRQLLSEGRTQLLGEDFNPQLDRMISFPSI